MSWATKYRPKSLSEIVGQEWPKRIVKGALKNKSLCRSWLIVGSFGCGKCVSKGTIIKTSDGLRRIEHLVSHEEGEKDVEDLYVLINGSKEKVEYTYNGGIKDTILCTTREDGIQLEGTLDHPVLVWENFNPSWKLMRDLKIGDILISELGETLWDSDSLDPKILYNWEVDEFSRRKITDDVFTTPNVLTLDVSYYLGLLAGDGFVNNNPGVYTSDYEIREFVERFHLDVFNQTTGVTLDKRRSSLVRLCCHDLSNYRKWVYSFYNKGVNSDTKEVPYIIWNAPIRHQVAFLQGIMDIDGTFSKKSMI